MMIPLRLNDRGRDTRIVAITFYKPSLSIAIKNEPFSQGGSGVGCGFAGALTG